MKVGQVVKVYNKTGIIIKIEKSLSNFRFFYIQYLDGFIIRVDGLAIYDATEHEKEMFKVIAL